MEEATTPRPAFEVQVKWIKTRGYWVGVHNSADASACVRSLMNDPPYWLRDCPLSVVWEGGSVRRRGERKAFAHVSPNGRVWRGGPKTYPSDEVTF